jgi:tetratricopeptide (TPR) repeat protein
MILGMLVGSVDAQTRNRPEPGSTVVMAEVPAGLADISGIEAGMSSSELVDSALEAAEADRLTDAEAILQHVIQIAPEYGRAYQALGYVYELLAERAGQNEDDPAAARQKERYIEQAIRAYVQFAGPMAVQAGQLQAAERIYNTVLFHDPSNPEAQLGLARVLAKRGSLEAIDRYKTYMNPQNNPVGHRDSMAYLELGRLYRERRYINLAVRALEKARQLNPENPEILMALALTYNEQQQREKALNLARSAALEKAPSSHQYRHQYARLLLANAQPRNATPEARQFADRMLADARAEARRAVELCREEMQTGGNQQPLLNPLVQYLNTYVEALQITMRRQEGRQALETRLTLSEVIREEARVARKRLLYTSLGVLRQAGPAAGANDRYLAELATVQYELGLFEEAAQTCQQLLEIDPGNEKARTLMKQLPDHLQTTTAPAVSADAG